MGRGKTTRVVALVVAIAMFAVLVVVALVVMFDDQPRLPTGKVGLPSMDVDPERVILAKLAVQEGGVLDTKIRLFRNHMKRLPVSIDELLRPPADIAEGESWQGPYVVEERLLLDPWGRRYEYRLVAEDRYEIVSCGGDGVCGTGDDIRRD
jgi:Type II secretion system (T2SS), protein G